MVGDEVILYGEVTKYNDTRETASKKAKVYSINWAVSDENGVGNVKYPFNTAGAKKFIDDTQAAVKAAKDKGETLTLPDVAVAGKINDIVYSFSAEYGTATFWMSDDGSAKDFEAYSVYFLENKPWEEGMTQIAVGDEVILKGQLAKYKDTYETSSKKAYVYSLNGVTELPKAAGIVIDGDMSDWADVTDQVASTKDTPVYALFKVTNDANNIYFYSKRDNRDAIWNGGGYIYYDIDADNNPETGVDKEIPGLEMWLYFFPFGENAIATDIGSGSAYPSKDVFNNFKFAGAIASDFVEIEASMPLADAGVKSGDVIAVYTWSNKSGDDLKSTPIVYTVK